RKEDKGGGAFWSAVCGTAFGFFSCFSRSLERVRPLPPLCPLGFRVGKTDKGDVGWAESSRPTTQPQPGGPRKASAHPTTTTRLRRGTRKADQRGRPPTRVPPGGLPARLPGDLGRGLGGGRAAGLRRDPAGGRGGHPGRRPGAALDVRPGGPAGAPRLAAG